MMLGCRGGDCRSANRLDASVTLQIFPKPSAANADPTVRALLEHFEANQAALGLQDSVVFYNFPLFREDEHLLVAEVVLISPLHGVVLIAPGDSLDPDAETRLEGAFNQIFSRLVKYPRLRTGRARLAFELDAFHWALEGQAGDGLCIGTNALDGKLAAQRAAVPLPPDVFAELVSVLDGSKALVRLKERNTTGFDANSKLAVIARLEEEIRKFDRDQRVAYMTEVQGTQRIRGLAGSGKTVVLAMKAAITAVREPDARIAVTFYTKSLYQHLKHQITRFYRMHEDRDPDWSKLQVLHAWGGESAAGLYYQAAKRFGHQALTFTEASRLDRRQPFAHACSVLLRDPAVAAAYDYVFVDEAQDFPPDFMRLALRLAIDERLVIAYDAFQTIFDVEVPTAGSMFGLDQANEPDVHFDEDILLHKCYRNPREILVCAHAVGFGVYGSKIVQMLESKEHWNDLGYEIVSGELQPDEVVVITRPEANSPSTISQSRTMDDIISVSVCKNVSEEVAEVVARVKHDIEVEGVPPEDILVICADDRGASDYLTMMRRELHKAGLAANNLHDDSYGIRDFQREGAVTLSTVYKAKGNEAYCVYIMGIDALFFNATARSRNKAFTAMTRAKGWLHVTGIGEHAQRFQREIAAAKQHYPNLQFRYPSPEQLAYMKRDLVQIEPVEAEETIERLEAEMEPEELEYILRKKLRQLQSKRRPPKKMK
jgi:superfamily I DNA and RNA helicase